MAAVCYGPNLLLKYLITGNYDHEQREYFTHFFNGPE